MTRLVWTLGVATATILLPAMLAADEFQLEEGFVRLDNGKDLNGWYPSTWNGQDTGNASGWSVVDGAIQLDATMAKSHLFSKAKFSRNCLIRLQFRAAHAADSGLCLHGKQFQVRDYPNALPDTKQFAPYAHGPGEWNDLEIDIRDGTAIIKLNGQVISKRFRLGDNADLGLGLQKEQGDFAYRRIRIRDKP